MKSNRGSSSFDVDRSLKTLKREFKADIAPELKRRSCHRPPFRRRNDRFLIPDLHFDEFTLVSLEKIRKAQESNSLPGVLKVPSDDSIRGGVAVVRVKDTNQVVICLDTGKQDWRRTGEKSSEKWGFPGGGRKEGESTARSIRRELWEEIHLYTTDNFSRFWLVDTVPLLFFDRESQTRLFSDKSVCLLYTEITQRTADRLRKGTEQAEIRIVEWDYVNLLIDAGMFLDNHTNYKIVFEAWLEKHKDIVDFETGDTN